MHLQTHTTNHVNACALVFTIWLAVQSPLRSHRFLLGLVYNLSLSLSLPLPSSINQSDGWTSSHSISGSHGVLTADLCIPLFLFLSTSYHISFNIPLDPLHPLRSLRFCVPLFLSLSFLLTIFLLFSSLLQPCIYLISKVYIRERVLDLLSVCLLCFAELTIG